MRRVPLATLALTLAVSAGFANVSTAARADDNFVLTIKDHMFVPPMLDVPAGKKVVLLVKNEDPTPEEFESHSLKVEKIVGGNKEIRVNIGPLKPGEYGFFGEFNEDTAKGVIIAK